MSLRDLVAVPVIHCHDAYGFVIDHLSGWRLVYVQKKASH
jgi:hypothetical protein